MTPESGHEKPSPNRAMKQLRRAHDQNELARIMQRFDGYGALGAALV
jgi:hypothetical protein